MRLLIVACIFGVGSVSFAQVNRPLQAGSVEAYRQERRSTIAAQDAADAERAAKDAQMWAKVKNAEQFIKLSTDARKKRVAELYSLREKARQEKAKPNSAAAKVLHFNKSIADVNDPTKPYIPDGMPAAVKKRVHLDEISGSLTRKDDVRTWAMKGGKSITGALVIYDVGKVTIKSMDGKQAIVKLVDLAPDDWDYVAQNAPAPKRRS